MAMYKTIFVSEEYQSSSENIVGINGEVLMFGENAFASVEQALGSGVENAIIIKVQSGKYDGFAVVTDGKANTDVTVMAVDFDGGEVMVGGENLTVADSGIAAADQATLLADLNDTNAGNGKVFVAASEATADMPTIYVGMGEAGYVAGAAAAVVTGSNMDEIANVLEGVISTPVNAASTTTEIYVSSEYNSSTEGWGTTHFADIQSAVAAASEVTGSTTIIELAAGSYNDDVDITLDKVSQKGDIVFKAAAGADVTIGGTITIGYYERGVGAAAWNAGVTFENITFDHTAAATHSLDVQAVKSFIMNNCKVIGDGEYGITSSAGNNTGHAEINNTVFTNAGIQSLGNFSSNLTIDHCTFNESRLNVQGGGAPGLQIINTTFNGTVTDEHVGDSFYFIRSNDCPIFIQDCTANVDSAVTGIATDQAKWGLLWQRQAGGTKWEVSGLVVNYTDAALAQTELLLNKNGTTNAANELGRITFIDLSSTDNDIADLLAKTEGAAMVEIDGKTYIYDDGSKLTFPTLYVDPSYTAANPGTGNIFGYNAFNSFTEALKAVGPNTEKIELSGDITEDATAENIKVELTKDLTISGGNVNWNAGRGWLWFAKADGVESANLKFENITISGADKNTKVFYFGEDVTTTIGSGASVAIYNGAAMAGSVVKVAEGGELISLKEAFQVQANGDLKATLIVEGANDFVAADATLDDRQVYFKYTNVDGKVDVTNGYFAAYDYVNIRNSGSFTADNSLIQIGANEAGVWSGNPVPNGLGQLKVSSEGSELNITNNSILEVSGNVTNNGTINIEDSTFVANGTIVSDGVIQEAYNRGAVTNNGTFNVTGDSKLNIGSFTGNAVQVAADATLTDSKVGGVVSVGYSQENAADTTLTLKGETSIGTLYVGKEGRENEYKAVITGNDTDVSLGQLYNRLGSTLEISDGAHLAVSNYWQSKGDVVIDGASTELTGVNMYVYNNDTTDAATIALKNGASLSTKANYAIYLGNSEGGPAKGNASMTLESGSSLNVKNLTLHADGEVEEVAGAKASTSVSVTDSTVNVTGTLTNNGTFTAGGESTLNIANMTGSNIQAADGAIIKDSTIGGGGITATGDLTLKGENKFDSFSMGYFGHDVTIGADASLETTGTGRLTLAYANTLDVDGSITNAKTADKATTKKSLNIKGGVSITGNASFGDANNGATLDVDNAYISLGSTTSKNSAATGDFVLDFNNSIIEVTKDFQIAASSPDSGLTPTYQLNIKDSVMTVADRFAFNHENGTAVIDNSTLDITNQFRNAGSFTLQNGSEMNVGGNADGPSYEKTGNFGTLNVKSGSTFAMADTAASAAYPFYNAGTVNVDGATFNVATVKNEGNFTVSGESTLKIANLSGNADITDAELQDGSYITNGDGTIYFNGSNAIDGAVTIGSEIYNYGKLDVKDGATFTNQSGKITYLVGTGASLNVAENATVKVNDLWNNVQGSAVSTIDGTVEISHNAWLRNATINGSLSVENQLAVYSNDAFNVNGELTINGNGSPAGWLIGNPGSSTGAYAGNITVNVTGGTVNVTGNSTGEEIIIQQYGIFNINSDAQGKAGTVSVNGIITNKGDVNITDGSMTSNYKITNSGTMNVTDGAVTASSITNTGTINLTVTAEKLATVGNDAYYIINQTGSGAALNNTVTIAGTEYSVGQSFTKDGVVYSVTAGTGNDIAIEALATVFFVDASYDENTVGYGFNKFSSFDDAVKALKNNDTVIKLLSDAEMSETTDPSFKLNVVSGDGSKHTLKINDATIDVDANFAKEIDIDTDLFMAYYNNHNVVIDGDLKGGIYNYGGTLTLNNSKITNSWDNSNIFGVVNINGDGTWTLDNAQADNLKFIGIGRNSSLNQGILNLNDTVVKAIQYTVDSQSANTKSQINAVNSTIGTVLNDGGWGNLIVTANGEVNLTNSNLNILGTLTNDGEINVTGDSTLNVNKLVGRINAADATIADGTVIGGKQGSLDLAGTSVSFDGDVTIDAAVNSYNSSDATTININEGANVVWNTKQYDLYHGGFNTDSGDTLNVLGNLTITGDNVYLKAATTVAEGGALNITDAGFQNTYGKLTVKGDMNITDTYNDGAYQNIKLAGNDNASTTGSLDVDGGTLTIDAPSFAFGGGFKSNGWVDVTSADVTVQNGGKITANAVVFRNGANSTVTLDNGTFEFTAAPDFGTVHVTLGTQIDNNGTIIAKNGSTLDFGDRTFINAGTIDVSDSKFVAETFDHQSATHAVFNDVDMDVTNFKNGVKDAGAYAIIGGNSKVQIDNLSGDRLHFADGTVLKGGTSIKGTTSTRSLGDITFGETENDMIHVDSFANNGTSAYDGTITVNGTLSISDNGDDKLSPTYWLGIHGSESGTLLTSETGKGVINSSGLWNIFQYGKITVDEGVTINIADAYARDLRFTLTDITIKGEINSFGNNNKLNAIQTSTVTLTGENAALNVDGYLLVGYSTYKGNNDTVNTYKSTLTVEDGATLSVGAMTYINLESQVNVNDAVYDAGDITNYGSINLAGADFSAGNIVNDGALNVTSAKFTADKVSGNGTFTIGSNVDDEGNVIATELQIGNLAQDVRANENGTNPIEITGNVDGTGKFRVYGDATLNSFNYNGGYTGQVVSATGQVLTYGDTVITGNSTISVNYFQATSGVVLEAGSTINAANMNLYDMEADADVVINGTVNACTFIVVNDYYNTGSGSEVLVAKDGVVNGLTQNGNGRFDIQSGNMTVQGYVNGTWQAGGGTAYIGNSGLDAKLVVDGIYAAADSNNGKFVNTGSQNLIIGANGTLEVVNGATFDWNATVTNKGSITVDADSIFTAANLNTAAGSFNSTQSGEMILLNDMVISNALTAGSVVLNSGIALTVGSITVDSLNMAIGSSLTITGTGSSIANFTVTGELAGDNPYSLVLSGWDNSYASSVNYKGKNYTIVDSVENLSGINFVVIDGNLYIRDFGAATVDIYIGDDVANWTEPKIINSVIYTKGENAFASVSDVTGIDVDEITSITLGSGDHMNDATSLFPNLSQVVIPNADARVVDSEIANFSGNVVIVNHGHMDVKLVANGTLDVTNTSVNTMLGSYTAEWISVDNTGRIGDATKAVTTLTATIGDIEIANSGTDAIVENVELVTDGNVYLSGSGFGEGISVKAFNLSLYGADIALENSTVETIYMTENSSFEYADGGELTLKAGSVIGKVNGYNGDTDKATGTVIFDGANLTDTAVQDVSKVVLASGTAHSIGKDSVFNDYREFYTEELNIASGAAFNFEHNDTSAADLHIGTTVSVDGTRVAVTGEGAMNVSNDGSEAYSMDNFDVSGFAGTLNVTTGTLVALEEDEDHVAATGTVNADGTVELNGTTVADIDFAITGAGSVKVNENKNFTGDISAYTGEYVIADDKTATYTADATLASDMTINGEGTADFADRTNPATVTLMSDTTTTPDIELHSNSAKLNGGAFGVIEGTANVDVIADSTAEDVKIGTMTVKAGKKLDVVGDGITATSGVVETTGDITLESGTDTVRTILNAAVAISAYGDINAGDYVTTTAQEVVVAGNIAYGDNAKMEVTSTDAAMGNITADAAITFGDNAEVTATNDITAGTDMTFGTDADVTATDITAAGNVTFGDTATVTASGNITAGTDVTFGTDADVTATDITATTGNVTFGDTATVTASGNIAAGKNVTFGAGTTATVGGDIWSGMMNAGEGIFAADNVKVSANDIYGKEIEFGDNAQVTVKRLNSSSDITFGSDAEVTAKHIIADNNITFGDNATVNASGNITGNDVGAITFGDNSEITVGGDIEASTALTTDPATGTITFGAENTVDVTGRISAVNAINVGVATELTAGKIYTPGALNISEHAKVTTNDIDAANINISILVPDASGFTGPSITLTAAVAKEKLGTLTIDADRSDFVSPYTVIDGVSSQLYNDLLVFVVGSESVNLNVNTAVAQEIAGYWVYGYVDNGDLLLDRMLVDNGEIFVNSDWTDNKGDRFYWGGNDVAHQHIVGNDAAKTLGYAASIVRAKADGSASNIYIVKGDTYEVDDLTLMTAANGVSKLVLSGDEVEAGTPDVAAGDALILGNLYGTDGSSATSLTLNNIAVKGNFFGGANNVALGGDVSTVINNASTAAAMRGMVFGGSNITSDIDDSAYSSTISLIGGGYSGSMVGGGAYVDGVSYAMKDSTISVAAGEGGERTVISGRLFGGSVAANGATVTQESANINIDLSNGQVYLRNDVYAAGANISGGSVNVAEANVSINGDLSNLNFTGRLSGGVYGTAIGSAANTVSDLTFSDATGTFKGLIQDFDTITISGNSAVTFSRKQTLTADTYFVFDLNGRTSADAMFTVNSFGWTYGDTITINTFDGVSGDYTLVGNWSDSYGVNLMIGSTAATIGSTATVNGNDYTLNVVNDALVLSYVGNNGVGLVDGAELSFANQTIAAGSDGRALSFDGSGDYTDGTVNLTDSTVDGDVYTGRYGEVALNTQGDTTIKGDISGYAKLVELTVESGKTTIEGTLSSGTGDDKVAVAAGAELAAESVSTGTNDDLIEISGTMNVTNDIQTGTDEDKINVADGASLSAAVIEMGTGDDTLVVGKNATLTATEISGGTNNDHLTLEKGAFVTADDVTMIETMSIDVDSVLNAGHYSWSTKPLTVTGVAGLTTDVAGAKTIFTNCNANKAINFDGVDAVLGTATQIAGTATTADTSDDVWASLSKVNNNLVVAWGRTETECGAALDAFKADTTLNLGEALVAVDDSLLNGFDSTDNTTKKSNGTLA